MGMSQERLASSLGVSHQLVQKYEAGRTRIGSSRLRALANALGVQVGFFFAFKEPVTRASRAKAACLDLAQTPEGARLFQAFARVRSERVRRKLILLVEVASEG
jgi:transcriptional regulator with XRE-family HTH domain